MRATVGDHLPALRRPAALAALAAAAGGVAMMLTPNVGLWRLAAEVQALDTTETETVATLSGAETTVLTWGIAALGLLVVLLALLVAVDLPPPHPQLLLLGSAAIIEVATVVLLLAPPSEAAFSMEAGALELVAGDVPLPTGVEITMVVRPGWGLWLLAGAGLMVAAGTWVALRRG